MAVRFILMMALMMVGTAHPGPDPDNDIHIELNQINNNNNGCGGGCCGDSCDKKSCKIDNKEFHGGDIYKVGCVKLFCRSNGQWEYLSIVKDCGECIVGAEPWVKTFNPVQGQYANPLFPGDWYRTKKEGTYVLTQKDRKTKPPPFGVNGKFYYATGWPGGPTHSEGSYVDNIIYYEDSEKISWTCKPGGGAHLTMPCKTLDLKHNGDPINSFPTNVGGIWIFRVDKTINEEDCIIIAGNVGLTVMVCMKVKTRVSADGANKVEYYDLPLVYIYASSSLANTLYGICNTFTGTGDTLYNYIGKDTNTNAGTCQLIQKDWVIETLCSEFMKGWEI